MKLFVSVFLACQAVKYMTMAHDMEITWNIALWGTNIPFFVAVLAGGACIALSLFFVNLTGNMGFSFMAGGMASNLFDRLFYGGVADYIWLSDAVVNAADICIVFGMAVIAVYIWRTLRA